MGGGPGESGGAGELASAKLITCHLHHADGSRETIRLKHSFNAAQMEWFRAGAALNLPRPLP